MLHLYTPPNVRKGHVPYRTAPLPAKAETLAEFRFFAIIKSWMEEDIIEATVRNLFVQGVDAVYLVDQASTDSTVSRRSRREPRLPRSSTALFSINVSYRV